MNDKTSDKRLFPCPFCGGEARINVSTLGIVTVDCTVCHACSNAFFKKNDGEKEAIAAWNTRKPMERIVERLEERYKNHSANINEFISNNDLESASKESLMKTECEIAIEIVKEEGAV